MIQIRGNTVIPYFIHIVGAPISYESSEVMNQVRLNVQGKSCRKLIVNLALSVLLSVLVMSTHKNRYHAK